MFPAVSAKFSSSCIHLTEADENGKEILQKLNQVETVFDQKSFCYELKIKGLLCEVFSMILYAHRQELTKFIPANQQELERLEKMLNYLNLHFAEVISSRNWQTRFTYQEKSAAVFSKK